ncbi:hypothetical protein LCGC14_0932790 [marine sediment metagenome]|uniref:Uncharacterized protein n=1 Tax=marine sediment metagenome TaxID=412755 RepID=A0A0F9P8H0_9ZZZZ
MIIDLFPKELTNKQKEHIIAELLKTEEGRNTLIRGLSWMDKPRKAP